MRVKVFSMHLRNHDFEFARMCSGDRDVLSLDEKHVLKYLCERVGKRASQVDSSLTPNFIVLLLLLALRTSQVVIPTENVSSAYIAQGHVACLHLASSADGQH